VLGAPLGGIAFFLAAGLSWPNGHNPT